MGRQVAKADMAALPRFQLDKLESNRKAPPTTDFTADKGTTDEGVKGVTLQSLDPCTLQKLRNPSAKRIKSVHSQKHPSRAVPGSLMMGTDVSNCAISLSRE